jgi:hypothetical protein
MKLTEYLRGNKSDFPPVGTVGIETNWLDVDAFVEVTTGSLWAGDPYICNAEDGCVVNVPNGTYILEAKAMDFAGRKRVSRLRVILQGVKEPVVGEQFGATQTDVAMMAVCDILALDEAIGGNNEKFQEFIVAHDYKDCGIIQFEMKKPIVIPYVSTGFGDCQAPVFELRSDGNVVGMELEFLASGYTFGRDED